jgi:hypothetical protein
VTGCCECGDEPSGSCATELVQVLTAGSMKVTETLLGYCALLFRRNTFTFRRCLLSPSSGRRVPEGCHLNAVLMCEMEENIKVKRRRNKYFDVRGKASHVIVHTLHCINIFVFYFCTEEY